jgi:uncharacterized membrane protein
MQLLANLTMYILALGVAGYAAVAYGLLPLGSLVHPDMKAGFEANAVGIYAHVFASIAALALGPFQFSSRLRQRNPALHRWSGRLYLVVGVLVGGVSGLYIAQFAFGGTVARLGFSLLAIGWLFTGVMAYLAIRRRDIATHRRWMVRNFALTFAAVTLRLYIGPSVAAGIPFEEAYRVIAWLCWVPNLIVAEWFFNMTSTRTAAAGE